MAILKLQKGNVLTKEQLDYLKKNKKLPTGEPGKLAQQNKNNVPITAQDRKESKIAKNLADMGTGVAVMGTQFRRPTNEEYEAGRAGGQGRTKLLANSAAWGLGNELTGGLMSSWANKLAMRGTSPVANELLQGSADAVKATRAAGYKQPAYETAIKDTYNKAKTEAGYLADDISRKFKPATNEPSKREMASINKAWEEDLLRSGREVNEAEAERLSRGPTNEEMQGWDLNDWQEYWDANPTEYPYNDTPGGGVRRDVPGSRLNQTELEMRMAETRRRRGERMNSGLDFDIDDLNEFYRQNPDAYPGDMERHTVSGINPPSYTGPGLNRSSYVEPETFIAPDNVPGSTLSREELERRIANTRRRRATYGMPENPPMSFDLSVSPEVSAERVLEEGQLREMMRQTRLARAEEQQPITWFGPNDPVPEAFENPGATAEAQTAFDRVLNQIRQNPRPEVPPTDLGNGLQISKMTTPNDWVRGEVTHVGGKNPAEHAMLLQHAPNEFHFSMNMPSSKIKAARAYMELEKLVPVLGKIKEVGSLSGDSFRNVLKQTLSPKFTSEVEGYIPMNNLAVYNPLKVKPNLGGAYTKPEAKKALQEMIELTKQYNLSRKPTIRPINRSRGEYHINLPNVALTKQYRLGGLLKRK